MDHKPQKKTKSDNDQTKHDPPPPVVRHLHEDLLENVFSFLPIKEAVQVGAVSTRFKKTWLLNRRLLFGRDLALRNNQQALVALVDRVFDSNKAPQIQAFCLHIDPVGVQPLIEKWVGICILKQIKELEFEFLRPFHLRSNFLDIQTPQTLKLVNCGIQLPHALTGLRFLNTLVLKKLELTVNQLKTLVSHCKLLGTLDLSKCSRIRVMNICASEHNNFKTLKIACCPDLDEINIDVPSLRSIFFCGVVLRIQFARVLSLNEALAARLRNGQHREMHFCLGKLRELQVFMEGETFCNPYDIAVFLRSCPCLEALFIDLNGFSYECGLCWQLNQKPMLDSFPYYFNRLRLIKLIGFKFEQYELELVKVLLQKAFNLEALVFITPRNNQTRLIYEPDVMYHKRLFQSWTASPRAKIFLFEHYNDRSFISPSHPKYWY